MSKQVDRAHEEALLQKRIEIVVALKEKLGNKTSAAAQTVAAYTSILDDIILDVAIEVHREAKFGQIQQDPVALEEALPAPQQPLPVKGAKGVLDAFGQQIQMVSREEVDCSHCGRRIAASRYAPHLEKCLGKGRNASRAASRRIS